MTWYLSLILLVQQFAGRAAAGSGARIPWLAGDRCPHCRPHCRTLHHHRADSVGQPAGHGGALQGPTPAVSLRPPGFRQTSQSQWF